MPSALAHDKATDGYRLLRCMSAFVADIVTKVGDRQPSRNNRIAASKSLNQDCEYAAYLESMLLARTPKIFLQQNRPIRDAPASFEGVRTGAEFVGERLASPASGPRLILKKHATLLP